MGNERFEGANLRRENLRSERLITQLHGVQIGDGDHEVFVGGVIPHDVGITGAVVGREEVGVETARHEQHEVRGRDDPLFAFGGAGGKGVDIAFVGTAGQHVGKAGPRDFRRLGCAKVFLPDAVVAGRVVAGRHEAVGVADPAAVAFLQDDHVAALFGWVAENRGLADDAGGSGAHDAEQLGIGIACIFCWHGHDRDHEMFVGRFVPHDVGFVLFGLGGEICGIEAVGGQDHHVRRCADPLLTRGRFHGKGVGVGRVRAAGQHVAEAGTVEFRNFAGHIGLTPGGPDRVIALRIVAGRSRPVGEAGPAVCALAQQDRRHAFFIPIHDCGILGNGGDAGALGVGDQRINLLVCRRCGVGKLRCAKADEQHGKCDRDSEPE